MKGNDLHQQIDNLNKELLRSSVNNPLEGLTLSERAARQSEEIGYPLGLADALLNKGRCLVHLYRYSEADEPLKKALDLYRSISDPRSDEGELLTLVALGVRAGNTGEYEAALNYYFVAYTQAQVINSNRILIYSLNNIGEINYLLGNKEEALRYYHKAHSIAEGIDSPEYMCVLSGNLGKVHLSMDDLDIAEEYLENALDNAARLELSPLEATIRIMLAELDIKREHYREAEKNLDTAVNVFSKLEDKKGMAEYRAAEAMLLQRTGRLNEALQAAEEAAAGSEAAGDSNLKVKILRQLSSITEDLCDYKRSLELLREADSLDSGRFGSRLLNRLQKITIFYETEQSETEKEAYRMHSLELERVNKQTRFINDIGKEITSSLDPETIMHSTCRMLGEVLDFSIFGIALYHRERREIGFRYFVENGERREQDNISLDDETSLAAWCLKNRKPVIINNRKEADGYVKLWKYGYKLLINSAIYLPILHGEEIIGCITIQSLFENAYTENQADLLGAVSSFIAIALENSRIHTELNKLNQIITSEKTGLEIAYRKIAHMANHDPLTDLPNRHLLTELLKRGINMADRERSRLAVFYMDLDEFKPVNDSLGHDAGDIMLKTVSDRICATLRHSDTVARIGGDEFVSVLYNCGTREETRLVAEKIISTLEKKIRIKDESFRIGISIGIAVYPDDDKTINGLIMKADRAMYSAKQQGKNRAVFYAED